MSKVKVTRDQQRAQAAYEAVVGAVKQKWEKKYGAACHRLPGLIHQCGLCQAVAFFQAKGEDKEDSKRYYFYKVLHDLAGMTGQGSAEGLAHNARTMPMTQYRELTREAMACAQWLKRYSQAVLHVDPTEDTGS